LFSKDSIAKIIDGCQTAAQRRPFIVDKIFDEGVKTFAILPTIGAEEDIEHFIERGELDARLPLSDTTVQEVLKTKYAAFLEIQWEFIPYRFARGHRLLRDKHILPITKETRLSELDGSFGAISRIEIPSSMQHFVQTKVLLVSAR